ncbi:MAG: Superoxide dismutase, Fe-Mn family [Hydrocarboniphaga sp.]|uniref:superoxide dismutase n=1 Tax=Hydrocarboniphaga sp. TaxID=2033016 RepID=UPI00260F307E|nr:Fe-Mn family superoxide dismutase [Hydrocarboniphaga sp.]MDB5972559.1 Superoxide dismutase, Fe-Mn family [Hydrocarboniphaga sp.]
MNDNDTPNDISRREALGLLGTGVAAAAFPQFAAAEATRPAFTLPPAFAGKHEPRPLLFDPAKLSGLSEKLIRSHWDNNYIGSVKALNMIEGRLAAAMQDRDFPPLVYGGLKREETHRVGSVVLHEHYFGNLGGDGKSGGDIAAALKSVYGSVEAWEAEFRRTALSLAGGSGWCVLSLNPYTGDMRNQWMWDHMHGAIGGLPLLVLDMYEHSFHMDYGSAAAKYLDAFIANVNWEVVDQRFQHARRFAV